jgi:hypothetical protein
MKVDSYVGIVKRRVVDVLGVLRSHQFPVGKQHHISQMRTMKDQYIHIT